jgi:hypothetical protein
MQQLINCVAAIELRLEFQLQSFGYRTSLIREAMTADAHSINLV